MGKKRGGYAIGREHWALDWEAVRTPLGLPGQAQAVCTRTSFVPMSDSLAPKAAEVHYYVSSATPEVLDGDELARIIREHWRIENCLHHVKDRTWLEDRHWVGSKKSGAVVTMLRSVACGLVRGAKMRGLKRESFAPERIEFFNQHPRQALKLITGSGRL
jgi:predicted transposase YbfD/YdcC